MNSLKSAAPTRPVSKPRPMPIKAFRKYIARFGGAVLTLALALSILEGTASAVTVVIDDFSAPPFPGTSYAIDALDPDPLLLKHPTAIGGERDLLVDVLGPPVEPVSATGTIGGGTYLFGTLGDSGSLATLQYDGVDADSPAPPASLVNAEGLNVDITGGGFNNGVRFEFLSVDAAAASGVSVRITATSAGASASYFGAIPANPNPANFDVLFTSFTPVGPFDSTAVTSFEVTFNEVGVKDVDFELDRILTTQGIVPEPSSLVLLCCGGLVGLLALRRRRAA